MHAHVQLDQLENKLQQTASPSPLPPSVSGAPGVSYSGLLHHLLALCREIAAVQVE